MPWRDVRTALLSDQLPSQHPHVAIVGITDQTLSDYKMRLPIDRTLLSRLVDAIDAAGAKVIGIDLLFYRTTPADNDEMLIDAVKRARAKVVLAVADERLGLSQPQIDKQRELLTQTGAIRRLRQPGDRARLGRALQGAPAPGTRLPQELRARAGGSGRAISPPTTAAAHRLAARRRATAPTRSSPSRPRRCWARPTIPGAKAARRRASRTRS